MHFLMGFGLSVVAGLAMTFIVVEGCKQIEKRLIEEPGLAAEPGHMARKLLYSCVGCLAGGYILTVALVYFLNFAQLWEVVVGALLIAGGAVSKDEYSITRYRAWYRALLACACFLFVLCGAWLRSGR